MSTESRAGLCKLRPAAPRTCAEPCPHPRPPACAGARNRAGGRLLGPDQLDPVVERQRAVDQPRQRRGHRRLQPGALDRACASSGTVSSASTAWPEPARGSRRPARPAPAARRRCGCARWAPGRWPPGRRCRCGPRTCAACRRRARRATAPPGRCPRPPSRRRSGPATGWRPPPPPRRSWPPPPARPPRGRSTPRRPRPSAGRPPPPGGPAAPSATRTPGPAPVSTISRACAGPPTQAVRSAPKTRSRATVGGVPSGDTSPLASDTTPGSLRDTPRRSISASASPMPLRRDGEEHQVGPVSWSSRARRSAP